MRLIDADSLKEEWKEGFHKKMVEALLDDAPTVEAITTKQLDKILEKLRAKIYEEIDFEEKWLNDVFWKDKGITLRDIEIAMNGIRHVVKGELEE